MSEREENQPSQTISISDGQLSNVQIGGQAGRDFEAVQSQQISPGSARPSLTPAQVSSLLDELKKLLQGADLPDGDKEKAIRNVETAKDEVQMEDPDKKFAAKSLQRATTVLKEAGETVEAGTSLWQKVKPIVESVSPWLGVATSFFV